MKQKQEERPGKAYQDLVATISKVFDPNADVRTGIWVKGPDGQLDMDVSIRGKIEGKPVHIAIECKDFDLKKTGKVGRSFIDALDSKRQDLDVDATFICSNAGFTEDALNKARRKGIGAISVLSNGDKRIKVVIEKEIYFRKITLGPLTFIYNGAEAASLTGIEFNELQYQGGSVDAWLQQRALMILSTLPEIESKNFTATFNFKEPTEFKFKTRSIILNGIAISIKPSTQWYAQKIQLDANLGIYDYLRKKIRLAPGENKYMLNGINFDTGIPLDSPPEIENIGDNLTSGEIDLNLVLIEGLPTISSTVLVPNLDNLILPKDLEYRIQ